MALMAEGGIDAAAERRLDLFRRARRDQAGVSR